MLTVLRDPSWTTSWARDPLYWTTLTLDSSALNWKEKHCMATVCFGFCVLCLKARVFFCQHFCVPPILTNYIQTGIGESLETHKSKFWNYRQYLSWTLSIVRSELSEVFPNITEKKSFFNISGIILNSQRSNVGYPTEASWMKCHNHRQMQRRSLPWFAGLFPACQWVWW